MSGGPGRKPKCECGEEDCGDCKHRLESQRSRARAAGHPDAEPVRKRGRKPKCECGKEGCDKCKNRLAWRKEAKRSEQILKSK